MQEIRDLPFTFADVQEAAADFVAIHAGARAKDLHPIAEQMASEGYRLRDLACQYGQLAGIRQGKKLDGYRAVSASISMPDFQQVLADGLRTAILQKVQASNEHRTICHPIPVPNFHPREVSTFGVDTALNELRENQEIHRVNITASDGIVEGQVKTYAAALFISREIIVNDDVEAIARIANQMAASVTRKEAASVYGLLSNNPDLPDGDPLFTGVNDLTATALEAAGLGTAMGVMRTQLDPFAQPVNNAAAHLVVAPGLEYTARKLVADIAAHANRPPMRVIAAPWVTGTRWYLQANPTDAPTLGFLTVDNPLARDMASTVVTRRKVSVGTDGMGLHVITDHGTVAMSRLGIVRGGSDE